MVNSNRTDYCICMILILINIIEMDGQKMEQQRWERMKTRLDITHKVLLIYYLILFICIYQSI